MAFLHYATHEKDTFASIEHDFGLAHTNFNHDFYLVLDCARDWAKNKFPTGTLEEHRAAAHKYVRYASFKHTTGLCDSKVFLCQRTRGTGGHSKWWWGPKHCRGTKVTAFVSHDKLVRLLLGPSPPYTFDADIIIANRRLVQRPFDRDDKIMADHHYSKMGHWKNVGWVLKHRKPRGRPLPFAHAKFNSRHKKIGLCHMEGVWGKVISLFPRLRTKVHFAHEEHYTLIMVACAIYNVKQQQKLNK